MLKSSILKRVVFKESVGNNCLVMEISIGIRYSNQLKYLLRIIIA